MTRDWPIQEVARLAGTTSRTLRHYANIGLLAPSRVGANGYRYYDTAALARLQRILLLRELGLGLTAIAEVLAGNEDDVVALETHLGWLEAEKNRIDRQIASVETTIRSTRGKDELMPEEMFGGFDHTAHRAEVERRWGAEAYAAGDAWWRSAGPETRDQVAALAQEWTDAAAAGLDPAGDRAQALARRHAQWLATVPGTPPVSAEYLTGLAELYVSDERFAANYGGLEGATFVRDALATYVASTL